jgi:hypothetical protein
MKRMLLQAIVELVLLYGVKAWTMSGALAKRLDGMYTRLLRPSLIPGGVDE